MGDDFAMGYAMGQDNNNNSGNDWFGGGGTVAKFISKHNIEVVDLGVPVIAMHAPYEVISKVDLYEAHRGFSAFNRY